MIWNSFLTTVGATQENMSQNLGLFLILNYLASQLDGIDISPQSRVYLLQPPLKNCHLWGLYQQNVLQQLQSKTKRRKVFFPQSIQEDFSRVRISFMLAKFLPVTFSL